MSSTSKYYVNATSAGRVFAEKSMERGNFLFVLFCHNYVPSQKAGTWHGLILYFCSGSFKVHKTKLALHSAALNSPNIKCI